MNDPKGAPATPKETPKTKLIQIEEQVLSFWNERQIFKRSLEKGGKEFTFYDGPPFATGLPHFGHLLPTTIKDVIPRYKTMQGFHVSRRWGWDCHGLPVENLIEKELGLKSRRDIQEYGIDKFNAAAKASVLRYANEWRQIIPRIGRWVDMENDYRTMDAGYTQSVWWAFKELFNKGLVYEGFKAMQLCPRCGTTLSNFEVNQGYKDITDISVYVKLELAAEPNAYFIAWTTTPWTLPGNVALAVGADIDYARVSHAGATYIIARDRVADVFAGKEHSLDKVVKGSELVGQAYKPLFSYYDTDATTNRANGWKVYAADFVTTTDGSGIVHIAPAFGEDDLKLGQANDLPFVQHVGQDGRFKPEVTDFAGLEVKPKGADNEKDGHQKTDIEVIKWLAHNGRLFEKKKIVHSYPHCWRCATPLLNYATSSWFVRVTAIKDELVAANQKVNWVPEDIRDGRFGKWLEGARDWAISRSRFWGAPIPVWRGARSGELHAVGNLEDLKALVKRSGNSYMLMRHGEAESNAKGISNSDVHKKYLLTAKGREQVAARAAEIAKRGVDVIVASDFERTKETARMVADACGIPHNKIVYDERLREYGVGPEREGKLWRETEAHVREHGPYPGMETPAHLKRRVFAALYDMDKRFQGKRILVVAHGSPLNTLMQGVEATAGHDKIMHDERRYFQATAELHDLDFARLPVNEDYDLDLHRPYIDKVEYVAPDGEELVRVPEVFDCWFESGSMPFAEVCYTGKALPHFDPKGRLGGLLGGKKGFPADFISEGLDQTRGWFYTLTVLGTALFGRSPFKNVVVNGLILAEDGQKMSKSKGNYPPLMDTLNKYGADSMRYFFASSPAVKAEDVRFSEKGVDEVSKKLLQRLDNVLAFYEMYAGDVKGANRDSAVAASDKSKDALDRWILSRLSETRDAVTDALEAYQIDRAARPLMSFVDDLSTWYLRRSRDRFKSDDAADRDAALATTRFVLTNFAKVAAPLIPFYTEYLYGRVKAAGEPESVHLCDWPTLAKADASSIAEMAEVRRLVTVGLEQRAKANVKVRQPLAVATVKESAEKGAKRLSDAALALIQDELNVKRVAYGFAQGDIDLDTSITPELKREGVARDLIRAIQEERKNAGLTVGDRAMLLLDSDEKGKELVQEFWPEVKRVTLVDGVEYAELSKGSELKAEEFTFRISLRKK